MEPWKGMEKSISFSHPLDDQSDVMVKMSKVVCGVVGTTMRSFYNSMDQKQPESRQGDHDLSCISMTTLAIVGG